MDTNAHEDRDSDALVDPGDDGRIMQPAEAGSPLDGPDTSDIPNSDEATDTSYTVHADDPDHPSGTFAAADQPGDE